MTRVCPRCRAAPPADQPICPEHGLYAVSAEALRGFEDAPLLGYVLDGRYALVDRIGGGGMGVVYAGLQLPIERRVAVKVLHAALTSTRNDRARFEREAKAMSALRSSHSVTLFDFGVVRDGALANLAFMVMELVEGEGLDARLRRGPLSPTEALGVMDAVADSLTEAHGQGIVHRDLKPDNVMLSLTHDGRPLIKVIDFGIARLDGARSTGTGLLLGTPQYMAPEQCSGAGGARLDARSDVYAAGILLFEMLSARRPFDGDEAISILVKQMSAPPPALPGADRDGILAAAERVIHRAMEKAPDARHQTIAELAQAFREAVEPARATASVADIGPARPRQPSGSPEPEAARLPVPLPAGGSAPIPVPVALAVAPADTLHESAGQLPTADFPGTRRMWWLALSTLLSATVGVGAYVLWERGGEEPGDGAVSRLVIELAPVDAGPQEPPPPMRIVAEPTPARDAAVAPVAPVVVAPKPIGRKPKRAPVPKTHSRPQRPSGPSGSPASDKPKTEDAPPKRRIDNTPDPRIRGLTQKIRGHLQACRCGGARRGLIDLRALHGGRRWARVLEPELRACRAPTVDDKCVAGRLVPK